MRNKTSDRLTQLIDLLQPMEDAERMKTVRAALVFLGSDHSEIDKSERGVGLLNGQVSEEVDGVKLTPKASHWLKNCGISMAALQSVFHIQGGNVEVIGQIPGPKNSDKVRQCYLLAGIKALLTTGEPRFEDKDARSLCGECGCYDVTNHSKYVKALRTLVSGRQSLVLTQPGMRQSAELIKEIADKVKV